MVALTAIVGSLSRPIYDREPPRVAGRVAVGGVARLGEWSALTLQQSIGIGPGNH